MTRPLPTPPPSVSVLQSQQHMFCSLDLGSNLPYSFPSLGLYDNLLPGRLHPFLPGYPKLILQISVEKGRKDYRVDMGEIIKKRGDKEEERGVKEEG